MLMAEATLLGIAQDGGRPQPSCQMPCCKDVKHDEVAYPTSLGLSLIDESKHLFDATRTLGEQLKIWGENNPKHVWLTHAHFGHVDGLGLFGRETIGAKGIKLHVSQKMADLIVDEANLAFKCNMDMFQELEGNLIAGIGKVLFGFLTRKKRSGSTE